MHDILELLLRHGAALVFLATLAARVGAPIPASPLLVVAGGLASSAQLSLVGVAVASIVANLLGDGIWFAAGRRYGHRVLRLLCQISISQDSCVRQSEELIVRWGGSSLIAAKFVPGISVVAAPMTGALKMSFWRFLVFDLAGAALWTISFVMIGVIFRNEIERVLNVMASAGTAAVVAVVVALFAMVAIRYWRRHRVLHRNEVTRIDVDDLRKLMRQAPVPLVIDVRSRASMQVDDRYIPGAISMQLEDLSRQAALLPRDRDIVLYCNCPNDVAAAQGARLLIESGMTRTRPLAGGLEAWVASGHDVGTVPRSASAMDGDRCRA